MLLKGEPSE